MPVLPAIGTPGTWQPRRRARSGDHVHHGVAHVAATSGVVARSHGSGSYASDDLAVVVADLGHDVGRHDHAAVGDAGGHERHLQRGGRDLVLADGGLGQHRDVLVEELDVARWSTAAGVGQVERRPAG